MPLVCNATAQGAGIRLTLPREARRLGEWLRPRATDITCLPPKRGVARSAKWICHRSGKPNRRTQPCLTSSVSKQPRSRVLDLSASGDLRPRLSIRHCCSTLRVDPPPGRFTTRGVVRRLAIHASHSREQSHGRRRRETRFAAFQPYSHDAVPAHAQRGGCVAYPHILHRWVPCKAHCVCLRVYLDVRILPEPLALPLWMD